MFRASLWAFMVLRALGAGGYQGLGFLFRVLRVLVGFLGLSEFSGF